jgi:hypothetical protein
MARHEADREDLFAELASMPRRVEVRLPGEPHPLVAGIRPQGWLSLYLGPDPVYQFDAAGRLRRAFRHSRLFRTTGTTLARMERGRSNTETTLWRRDLTDEELQSFRQALHADLDRLANALENSTWTVLRQMPAEAEDLLPELLDRITAARQADPWLAPAIAPR